MVNPEILDYVRQQLNAHASKEQITQLLAAQGWSADDINEAFKTVEGVLPVPAAAPAVSPAQERHTATMGKRFLNFLLDTIFSTALSYIVGFFYGFVVTLLHIPISVVVSFILGLFVYLFYYIVPESIWQRTPGKWITGTKVIKLDGTKAGVGRILGRTLCRYIPFEILTFLIGRYPYGWHDRISKTMVVSAEYTAAEAAAINPRNRGKSRAGIVLLLLFLIGIPVLGIMSGIILAALGDTRQKGTSAGIQASMRSLAVTSLLYSAQHSNFTGFCTSTEVLGVPESPYARGPLPSASQFLTGNTTSYSCNDSETHWAASVPLPEGGYICLDDLLSDETGKSVTIPFALGTSTSCGSGQSL